MAIVNSYVGHRVHWLVVWNMTLFFHNMWDVIIPTDELVFFRGVGQPPARYKCFFLMGKPVENPRNISVNGGFGGII